jgi:hypothetical protein
MQFIPVLRTKRITMHFREPTIIEAIEIAGMDPARHELGVTRLLGCVVERVECEDPRLKNCLAWTVQERMMAVGHYLAAVADDGPDFSIGDYRFTSYLRVEVDYPAASVEVALSDAPREVHQLIGAEAEAIEAFAESRRDWVFAALAAQVRVPGEIVPDPVERRADYDAWLRQRVEALKGSSESAFVELVAAQIDGQNRLAHLFNIGIGADGFVALPATEGEAGIPPARFLVASCVTPLAKALR